MRAFMLAKLGVFFVQAEGKVTYSMYQTHLLRTADVWSEAL